MRTIACKVGPGRLDGESLYGDWLTRGATGRRSPDTDHSVMYELARLWGREWAAHFQGNFGPSLLPQKPRVIHVRAIDVGGSLRELVDSTGDILERLNSLITLPGWKRPLESLDPIMPAPSIDDPMYRRLADRSLEALSPGLGGIRPNTILLLEENRKFIEAHLVGLNHEMNRELLWRGYPTDQKGTVFKYFWDSVGIEKPEPAIEPIDAWNMELGSNRGRLPFNKLVLVIKGDLIRRYPDTIIFAVSTLLDPAVWQWSDVYAKLESRGTTVDYLTSRPTFSARAGPDTIFLGFPFSAEEAKKGKHYFVMMQHPTLPRFGLNHSHVADEGNYVGWDSLSWEDVPLYPLDGQGNGYPDRGMWIATSPISRPPAQAAYPKWGDSGDAAAMAWITFQDPVRMVIPASIFLTPRRA